MGKPPGGTVPSGQRRGHIGNLASSGAPRSITPTIAGRVKGKDALRQGTEFLLNVAALEAVRRVSRWAHWPHAWHGVQALQFCCYPPFKWIQRWASFWGLIKGVQIMDELHRFYAAASGDFATLLSMIKKTIWWKETYRIMSEKELEVWLNVVFWHGFDLEHRSCLVVRLGHACAHLPLCQRPRFVQAVVSKVDYGVLHLVDKDKPYITVLVDCDGITPLRIPMQMVLKSITRNKMRISGSNYHRVVAEYLQTLPSYLGGNCSCKICSKMSFNSQHRSHSATEISKTERGDSMSNADNFLENQLICQDESRLNGNWDHQMRTAVSSILMVWAFIALVAGLHDPESRPF